ncbi:hypothetical protein DPEC_G00220640 [Dallia pectoralis]|uniref:Uncharacterized protein n=1 Tax=Dallia pectoralis TaxID=75939 RepID=A0ACC2G3N0_DALPE|nr:hypothetical protein DPEC_G00220640 [Dallia pectoralis]
MSNVQLSCGALERLAAGRTLPLHGRTGACRALFGPVDHDELNREMRSKMREISDRDQRVWNFNFEADVPLSGDYEWEEARVDTTPVFYRDSVQTGRTRSVIATVNVDFIPAEPTAQDALPICEDRLGSTDSRTPCATEVINQENCAVKLNSGTPTRVPVPCVRRRKTPTTDATTTTHITDFYAKRKRTTTTENKMNEGSFQHPSSPVSLEQTPRKRIR